MRSIDELKSIMARLRGPDGCPWDREQTADSLKDYLLEECYELLEALESDDPAAVRGELGDLLFQIVFLSRLYEEQGHFDLEQVAATIADKMVARHPHVFGTTQLETSGEVVRQWGELKAAERGEGARSILDGVPRQLPALQKCRLLSDRASGVGFDWPDAASVLAKVREELVEVEQAMSVEPHRVGQELGDLLFAVANLARKLELNPEACLQQANGRFAARFRAMEEILEAGGRSIHDASPEELEVLWEKVKEQSAGRSRGVEPG